MGLSLAVVAMRQPFVFFEKDKDAAWMVKSSMKRLLAAWTSTDKVRQNQFNYQNHQSDNVSIPCTELILEYMKC